MSAPTVDHPAVEVDRIPMARVYALILAEVRRGLPVPYCIRQNGPDSTILCLNWASAAEMGQWDDYLGLKADNGYEQDGQWVTWAKAKWNGWTIQAYTRDPLPSTPVLDAETAALIDDVTAACSSCGGEVVHQHGCPAVEHKQCPATWYDGPCPGEVRHDDGRCDTHTSHNLTYDEPTVYVPVAMPTGDTANAECARMLREHHTVTTVEVDGPVSPGPLAERDDNAAMRGVLPAPVIQGGCARCATSHPHAADTHSYTEGCKYGPNPTAAALMARVTDPTIELPVRVPGAALAANPPPQTSFAQALPRLEAQHVDDEFAQIVAVSGE